VQILLGSMLLKSKVEHVQQNYQSMLQHLADWVLGKVNQKKRYLQSCPG